MLGSVTETNTTDPNIVTVNVKEEFGHAWHAEKVFVWWLSALEIADQLSYKNRGKDMVLHLVVEYYRVPK